MNRIAQDFLPGFILDLPKAKLPMDNVQGNLLSSERGQAIFLQLPEGSAIAPHHHGEQWGVVLKGAIRLTIGGEEKLFSRGDSYHIPAGVTHSARIVEDAVALDFFADPDRYLEE